jgi:hypothetical protein
MTAGAVFAELVGQEAVVEQLRAALAGDGLTHAWLFTGPPGSGRSVAARAFAAALLCGEQGCGQCPSCRQVAAGTHPDLLVIRPDGLSYGVRQTRDLVLRAGRARRLATDQEAARRRAEVLDVPARITGLGEAFAAAEALVKAAEAEAAAVTAELDAPEREALRRAFGEGSTGKGVAAYLRGSAGAMRELEDRQKSRATRVKRDSLDRALLDLAGWYRDVLAVQLRADVELASPDRADVAEAAATSQPEVTVRKIEAIMTCRQRLAASVAPLLAVEELALALAR